MPDSRYDDAEAERAGMINGRAPVVAVQPRTPRWFHAGVLVLGALALLVLLTGTGGGGGPSPAAEAAEDGPGAADLQAKLLLLQASIDALEAPAPAAAPAVVQVYHGSGATILPRAPAGSAFHLGRARDG